MERQLPASSHSRLERTARMNQTAVQQQATEVSTGGEPSIPRAATVDMKLEIVVIPVSDADRAKKFYASLGWRLDADYAHADDFRIIQFTPHGSGCSIIFGKNLTAAAPGSAQGLYMIVTDIEAARQDL